MKVAQLLLWGASRGAVVGQLYAELSAPVKTFFCGTVVGQFYKELPAPCKTTFEPNSAKSAPTTAPQLSHYAPQKKRLSPISG